MGNLLIDIIELSIPISMLIAVLLMFSPLLKRAYIAKWRYFMWLFVAVRLLLPVRFKYSNAITMSLPQDFVPAEQTTQTAGITPLQIMTVVWLVGICVFAVYRIVCYISFMRLVKRWQSDIDDEKVFIAFKEAKEFAGVKRQIEIKRCKAISSPMVFGIIKPVLLMPEIDFTDEELAIILRHELVHLKRCDILYKLLVMIVCTVYWFNPMVYLMSKAANKDLELACDAEVVKKENSEYRCRYCEAIMRLVHNRRGAKTALSTCFFFSKKTVMERFKYILDEKIKRSGVIMFCVVAFSFAVSGGVVSFATERAATVIEEDLQILEREPEAAPAPEPTEEPAPNEPESAAEVYTPEGYANETINEAVYESYAYENTEPSYSAESTAVEETAPVYEETPEPEVQIGADRDSVYDAMGEPDSVSSDGSRETYNLSDGNTAVLQYDDGVLESGYILVN